MSNAATFNYYRRIQALEAEFRPLLAAGKLPEATPPLVMRENTNQFSSNFGKMEEVLESVWLVTKMDANTGRRQGTAVLCRPRLAAEKIAIGSHELCLRERPDHVAAIDRHLKHQRDQKAKHDLADSKLPGQRVNVGVGIRVPGEDR